MIFAAILQMIVAMQVKKEASEFLRRKDLPNPDQDQNNDENNNNNNGDKKENEPKTEQIKDKLRTLDSTMTVNSEAELIKIQSATSSRSGGFNTRLSKSSAGSNTNSHRRHSNQEIFDQLHGQHRHSLNSESNNNSRSTGLYQNQVELPGHQTSILSHGSSSSGNKRNMRYQQNSLPSASSIKNINNNNNNVSSILNHQPLAHVTHFSLPRNSTSQGHVGHNNQAFDDNFNQVDSPHTNIGAYPNSSIPVSGRNSRKSNESIQDRNGMFRRR